MASSAASMRLRWPDPMPWILSAEPMTTAFDRVKAATVQTNTADRNFLGEGLRRETISTSPGPAIFDWNRL